MAQPSCVWRVIGEVFISPTGQAFTVAEGAVRGSGQLDDWFGSVVHNTLDTSPRVLGTLISAALAGKAAKARERAAAGKM